MEEVKRGLVYYDVPPAKALERRRPRNERRRGADRVGTLQGIAFQHGIRAGAVHRLLRRRSGSRRRRRQPAASASVVKSLDERITTSRWPILRRARRAGRPTSCTPRNSSRPPHVSDPERPASAAPWRISMFYLLTLPFRMFFGLLFGLLLPRPSPCSVPVRSCCCGSSFKAGVAALRAAVRAARDRPSAWRSRWSPWCSR